jgi:hypothetical protein
MSYVLSIRTINSISKKKKKKKKREGALSTLVVFILVDKANRRHDVGECPKKCSSSFSLMKKGNVSSGDADSKREGGNAYRFGRGGRRIASTRLQR